MGGRDRGKKSWNDVVMQLYITVQKQIHKEVCPYICTGTRALVYLSPMKWKNEANKLYSHTYCCPIFSDKSDHQISL